MSRSQWCVIVPVSASAVAKSRLSDLGEVRTALARAFTQDVLSAATSAATVSRVLLVSDGSLLSDSADTPPAVTAVVTGNGDLNAAIAVAEHRARAMGYQRIAVLVADIACVRSSDIDEVLGQARTVPRAYVVDHRGRGTTVLTTTGPALAPAFGVSSAHRHRASGAVALEVSARVSFDIDEPADITLALMYGVGEASSRALRSVPDGQRA